MGRSRSRKLAPMADCCRLASIVRSLTVSCDRADIVVDFSQFEEGDTLRLLNGGLGASAGTTDQLMQFRVVPSTGTDTSNLPTNLSTIPVTKKPMLLARGRSNWCAVSMTRTPAAVVDGSRWTDSITENVVKGELEVWEIVNTTGQSHPIHLHLEAFQVLDRTGLFGDIPLEDHELGWEDTFTVDAGETVRLMVKYEQYTGTFVWHWSHFGARRP